MVRGCANYCSRPARFCRTPSPTLIMPPMLNDPFQRLNLDREVLTVSQLNGRARLLLEDVFAQVWVEGEISNLARPASGHIYFTLKDKNAQIRCALFRQNAARGRQALRDGLAVKVRGKVSLFEGRGDDQLILDSLEPAGDGALRLAFEALKEKLAAEGLFDATRDRKSTRLNSSHVKISYAVFCLKK